MLSKSEKALIDMQVATETLARNAVRRQQGDLNAEGLTNITKMDELARSIQGDADEALGR